MIKLKTLFFLLLFSAVTFAQGNNVDKRVVYLWDVTYSMHGGRQSADASKIGTVTVAGSKEKIVGYDKKYDIYAPVLEALVQDIEARDARTEVVVIAFNDKVCKTWKHQATTDGKAYLISEIKNYKNMAQTKTSIYNALEAAKEELKGSKVSSVLKILTDGKDNMTYDKFIKTLEGWCEFAEANKIVASYYFMLTDKVADPALEDLLKDNCMITDTFDNDIDPDAQYALSEKFMLSVADNYGCNITFDFSTTGKHLDGNAVINISVEDNEYISLDVNETVTASTTKIAVKPMWKKSQRELRDLLPTGLGESVDLKVNFKVESGKLVLSTPEAVLSLTNREIKNMSIQFK
jgi:spore coat protein CotF